ncbi:poly [ADP-ribose] polymerase [Onthophagus taurus]|uniref:poly [ADP-ribose] polymerase n=1 Tax=Onthophagus taurus TaxID=166361 RepID=UPI0039BE5F02
MDLPYRAEYAKSGRASCKGCKSAIGQGTLRLAVMIQSPKFDGKQPNWYHHMCFFTKQRPKSVDDIENYETLRNEDQEFIKQKVDSTASGSSTVVPAKKGKKRDAESNNALKDFKIEYSKSSRAACRGCEQKILKDEIRISKKDFETDVGKRYGGQDKWHHLTCFANLRSELGYYENGDKLPGFNALKADDKKEVKSQLPAIKQEDVPEIKKVKKEEELDPVDVEMKEQNKIMYKYRDELKNNLNKKSLQLLLERNEQEIPPGEDNILNRLADIMTFGALEPCKECGDGQFVYSKIGYVCNGDKTEWTKCNFTTKEPARKKFVVPKEMKEEYPFLKKYKYVKRTRIIKDVAPSTAVKKEDEVDSGPKVERAKPALYEMKFVILKVNGDKQKIKNEITKLGGKIVTKIDKSIMAVISTEEEVERMGSRIAESQTEDIQVVSEKFLDEVPNYLDRIPELIKTTCICSWGSDPNIRLQTNNAKSESLKSKSKSMFAKSGPSKIKLTVKGGTAVDPDSGLEGSAHVYVNGSDKFTAILGLTDIQKQKNSFYKLQLLESDKKNRYWVFRAWGRIGTTIGDNKLEPMDSLHAAKTHFCQLYEEKSGNQWENRNHFVKVPGMMYPIDVEYVEDNKMEIDTEVPSKLDTPIQDLIKFIFDINSMKNVMLEFELDTEKMPLGKLSKKQIQKAFSVLTELQNFVDKKSKNISDFLDASNRFYTYIPHSFGTENPPIIDKTEMIQQKVEMLNNLLELEIAYNLMKGSGSDHGIDAYYDQLKTEIAVLNDESEEFCVIKEYLKNTHATTHDNYDLEIERIFEIKRSGEEKRYKPFKKLHNRKLLWHGSRRTNYAGILSQGLRIAPPEAPVTGYMFGKGIYFADMVSKSANYCCTDNVNSTGLLLLCEVALGDMLEKEQSYYVEKLPKGKHSCKGVGRTHPDPNEIKKLGEAEVPVGKPTQQKVKNSSLLYNEYIVYDVAQVHMKYLLQVKFNYKY